MYSKGSETERQRIRASYLSCGGNINKIMSDIPFAWADDKERITQIVEGDYTAELVILENGNEICKHTGTFIIIYKFSVFRIVGAENDAEEGYKTKIC